jgi:hypothetical protein
VLPDVRQEGFEIVGVETTVWDFEDPNNAKYAWSSLDLNCM